MSFRRKSQQVLVGSVTVGGLAPVVIQSMTNTDTADVAATVRQVRELTNAGSELVRVTVNNEAAAVAVPEIVRQLKAAGCDVPIIGDFHYNGHILLTKFPQCARALAKYRINPGNVGSGELHEKNFRIMIEAAIAYDKPVRIGVNWGSLDRELLTRMMDENALSAAQTRTKPKSDQEVLLDALVESALQSAKMAEKIGLPANKIILSVKTSEVPHVIKAYEMLAARCDYALHLGLTEAGMGTKGIVASSAALAVLLHNGIGDTIRVSLTPEAGESRAKEVEVCQRLLQTMGLRQFRPIVTSCPGCGRTGNDLFQRLAKEVNEYVGVRMPEWKKRVPGVEKLKIAVMGCVVNGPGESQHADIALSLPGKSEKPIATVFVSGKLTKTLRGENIGKEFLEILEEFIINPISP